MKTRLTKILFTLILFSVTIPLTLFSAEAEFGKIVFTKEKSVGQFERTKLLNAISRDQIGKVRALIQSKVDVNFGEDIKPLMMAACRDNSKIVKLLIRSKAEVNSQSKNRATPLMFVVPKGNLGIARELVEAQADPNIEDSNGFSALQMASLQIDDPTKKSAMLGLLLGVDETADIVKLVNALFHVDVKSVKLLLENRADINYRNGFPLKLVLSTGNIRMIELFTEHMTDGRSAMWQESDTE